MLKLPNCGCQKYVHRTPVRNPKFKPLNGTCSLETFDRGPGQKVIGFTFYEPIKPENSTKEDKSKRNYFQGIIDNLQLAKDKYGSDWIVRVYYHVNKDSPVMKQLCDLACAEPNLDLCDAEDNPRLGNATLLYPLIWRFLPAMDVNVDLYLSRDLDSRISDREVGNEINFHFIGNTTYTHDQHISYTKLDKTQVETLNQRKKTLHPNTHSVT